MTNVVLFGAGGRPNPDRFKEARRAKGLNQTELADAVGLTRQAISSYEMGDRQPEPPIFIRIAQVLGQPLSYFTSDRPGVDGPIGPAFFRSRKAAAKALNDRCEIWREWFAQSASLFSGLVKFPEVSLLHFSPRAGRFYSADEIEDAAKQCRRAWTLGDGPLANVIGMLESKGIVTARAEFGTADIDAFSFWAGYRPMIVLSSDKNVCARSRFDAAHELGHLVLHRGVGEEELEDRETLDQIESEANRFAGAFLMPPESYAHEVFTTRIGGFVELKKRWKVSVAAQIYRCANLGLITDDQVLNLRKQISRLKWRQKEPLDDELKPEQPMLLRKAFELVVSSRVATASDIATRAKLDTGLLAVFFNIPPTTFAPTPPSDPFLKLSTNG